MGITVNLSSSPGRLPRHAAWSAVALLWFAYALNYFDRQMIFSMFPLLRRDLGFTDPQLGLVGTVFLWVYSLAMPFTGRLADRVRRDRLIVWSVALWSLATLGTGLSASVPQVLGWRVAMGLSEALYMPAAVGLIVALHPFTHRSKALAIHNSAQFLGVIAGGWYGGWTADSLGFRTGFLAISVAGLGYALLLALSLRRPPDPPPAERASPGAAIRGLLNPGFAALASAFFCLCVILWMFYTWFPNFLFERFALSMTQSGLTATLYLQVSSAIGVVSGGILGDRLARRHPRARGSLVAAGLLLAVPFAFVTLSQPSLELARLSAAGFGLCSGIMIGNTFAAVYDVVPHAHYSFAIGIINMLGGISGGAAVFLTGLWKSSFGFPALMRVAAVAAGLAALLQGWVNATRRLPASDDREAPRTPGVS